MTFLCAKWCEFKVNILLNMLEFRMRNITEILLDFFIPEHRDPVFCIWFSRNVGILVNSVAVGVIVDNNTKLRANLWHHWAPDLYYLTGYLYYLALVVKHTYTQ